MPPKTEYELTPLGESLIEAIKCTVQRGEGHREEPEKIIRS